MSDTTAHLALPLIAAGQAQKHVTHNEALALIDAILQCAIQDKDLAAPPASPVEGSRYIVAASPAGDWAGKATMVALRLDGAWTYLAPTPGFIAYVLDEALLYVFKSTGWVPLTGNADVIQSLRLFGLGTIADSTNPFSAKLNKALWTALTVAEGGTGDLRYTLNKESAAKVLSLLFQTGYSGRLEFGLVGSDNPTLKVSADGSTWRTALAIDAASGGVDFLSAETLLSAASTTDLGASATRRIGISGPGSITSFGTAKSLERLLRFRSTTTLVHNATSLILPGAANIAAVAGDTAIASSDTDGYWTVRHYQKADGTSLVGSGTASRTTIGDAGYTATSSDRYVALTASLTAPRIVTLPAASAVAGNTTLTVGDEVGGVTATNTLTVSRSGSDTVNGASSLVLANPYARVALISDGTSRWAVDVVPLSRGGTGATSAAGATANLNAMVGDSGTGGTKGLVAAPAAGDAAAGRFWAADGTWRAPTASGGGDGQCVLVKSGANLVLQPRDGNQLNVNGVACTVPDAGVSAAATGLTAGTTYYVYATASAGAVSALEFSTTAPAVSTSAGTKGQRVKTGDVTRRLVGMIRPITGPAFADTDQQRFVRSWFNRPGIILHYDSSTVFSTTSASAVEIATAFRREFLIWADESYVETGAVTGYVTGGATTMQFGLGIDGVDTRTVRVINGSTSFVTTASLALGKGGLSEGYHYAGSYYAGTGTSFYGGNFEGAIR